MITNTAIITILILGFSIVSLGQNSPPKIVRPKKVPAPVDARVKQQKYDVPIVRIDPEQKATTSLSTVVSGIAATASLRRNEEGKTAVSIEFTHDEQIKPNGTPILWIVTKAGMYTKVGEIPAPNKENESVMMTNVELEELGLLITIETEPVEQPRGKLYGAFKSAG